LRRWGLGVCSRVGFELSYRECIYRPTKNWSHHAVSLRLVTVVRKSLNRTLFVTRGDSFSLHAGVV
jgi:hypothetical protein